MYMPLLACFAANLERQLAASAVIDISAQHMILVVNFVVLLAMSVFQCSFKTCTLTSQLLFQRLVFNTYGAMAYVRFAS
jgi:hypothetical protein